MYQSIFELPTQVLNSLNEEDATKWMSIYNEIDPTSKDEVRKAKRKAWEGCKTLPSSFSFEILASTDEKDQYDEVIDSESLMKSIDSFIDSGGNIQNDHHDYTVGCIWDWSPCKVKGENGAMANGVMVKGNIYGGYVGSKIRKSFIEGGMNKLSIAGEAPDKAYQCDEKGCYTRRKMKQLMEISLTKSPVNRSCVMKWSHEADDGDTVTKSLDDYNIDVQEYTIHRSNNECPIMSLKRSLTAIGYDAHAREDGVHIPMDFDEFVRDEQVFKSHGLDIDYHDGYATVTRSTLDDHFTGINPDYNKRKDELYEFTKNSRNPNIIRLHDRWQNWGYINNDTDREQFLKDMQKDIWDAQRISAQELSKKTTTLNGKFRNHWP